jgi:bifunctional ADP-heptose synthase (sugar kinase/adenylyltransferase)
VNLDGFTAIKLKDGGCMLWADGQAMHIASVEVTVVETTGAGDAFTGMFAIALLEGQTPHHAALLATAASHLDVTGWGSQPAYLTRAEILEFAHRLTQSYPDQASARPEQRRTSPHTKSQPFSAGSVRLLIWVAWEGDVPRRCRS